MSLLFRVVFANECRSTHHKLALDALQQLTLPDAPVWRDLFIYHFDAYLDGAKAPDKKFRDFRNHVLHVHDNGWGGAISAADKWYQKALSEFRQRQWKPAIYSAGVLSHYFTDPFMPFHTGQSEEETQIHRAVEWSITKSYDVLKQRLLENLGGYPRVEEPKGDGWLAELITEGALEANESYQMMIDHYDFAAGVKDPPTGLDDAIRDAIAQQLGLATIGFALVLDNLLDESGVVPIKKKTTLEGYMAALTIPIAWVTRKISDLADRKAVRAMFDEFEKNGRVKTTIPDDDRAVRELHAKEVLGTSVAELEEQPLEAIGGQHGKAAETSPAARPRITSQPTPRSTSTRLRYYLSLESTVVDAPSIGPKTAKRLNKVKIGTVRDLLDCDVEATAKQLAVRHISAEVLEDWQAQAALVCCIPNLRGTDAQLLVACDYVDPDTIQTADIDKLLADVHEFAKTREGKRVLRSSEPPDRAKIEAWIAAARHARTLQSAAEKQAA